MKVWLSKQQRELCLQAAKDSLSPEDRQNPKKAHHELSLALFEGIFEAGPDPEAQEFARNFSNLQCSRDNKRQREAVRKELFLVVQEVLGFDGKCEEKDLYMKDGGIDAACTHHGEDGKGCGNWPSYLFWEGQPVCFFCAEKLTG